MRAYFGIGSTFQAESVFDEPVLPEDIANAKQNIPAPGGTGATPPTTGQFGAAGLAVGSDCGIPQGKPEGA
jgi:hypothetical protein